MNNLKKLFQQGKLYSTKHSTYFNVYEKIISKYIDKNITLVEIGVLNGGSLELWKNYLGNKARIIGIDLNPEAKKYEQNGFEIVVGDQSKESFWKNFYDKYGKIDILIDDGGHENIMQAQTVISSLENIKNDGVIIIEDTHSSYLREFGNPSKYSFVNYCYYIAENINKRFFLDKNAKKNIIQSSIWSIEFFESIVVININRDNSNLDSYEIQNNGVSNKNLDFRHSNQSSYWLANIRDFLSNKYNKHKHNKFLRYIKFVIFPNIFYLLKKLSFKNKMKKFFKNDY